MKLWLKPILIVALAMIAVAAGNYYLWYSIYHLSLLLS